MIDKNITTRMCKEIIEKGVSDNRWNCNDIDCGNCIFYDGIEDCEEITPKTLKIAKNYLKENEVEEMKTYNIIEALNEPVGTEFNILNDSAIDCYTIKKAKVCERGQAIILIDTTDYNDGTPYINGFNFEEREIHITKNTANFIFQKVRKPLTFFEAMKLVDEGKKVTNDYLLGLEDFKYGYYFKGENGKIYHSFDNEIISIVTSELKSDWYEVED